MRENKVKCGHAGGIRFLKILGGVAIALAVAGIISQFDDIRRYIKISTM
jgi:Family of unknown function (DUF6893)